MRIFLYYVQLDILLCAYLYFDALCNLVTAAALAQGHDAAAREGREVRVLRGLPAVAHGAARRRLRGVLHLRQHQQLQPRAQGTSLISTASLHSISV
jgi:hypothetical protein